MRWLVPVLALMASGCLPHLNPSAQPPDSPTSSRSNRNSPAQNGPIGFVLPVLHGPAKHDLQQDRGHVVLLDVWATWCDPCRESLPIYRDFQKQYAAQGLRLYALNVDEDVRQVERFVKSEKLDVTVLLDPSNGVADKTLGVRLMPTLFILDRRGRVRHIHEGWDEQRVPELQAEIDALLAEPGDAR